MNARVVKKKDNYYIALESYENGERVTKSISVRKELGLNRPAKSSEAKALRDKIMTDFRQGTYIAPTHKLLKDYLVEWIDGYKYNLKTTTHESYVSFINHHIIPEIGGHTIPNLRPSHLRKLYAKKLVSGRADGKEGGLSARSVKYIHTIILLALGHAVQDEIVSRNVAELVSPPRAEKPQIKYWSWDQAKRFLAETEKDRYYIFYLIALSTGMARGEILGLRWQDINWDKYTISIRQTIVNTNSGPLVQASAKTETRERTLDVTKGLLDKLKEYRKRQAQETLALGTRATEEDKDAQSKEERKGLILTAKTGKLVMPRTIDRSFQCAINRINKKEEDDKKKNKEAKSYLPLITIHCLRHTYATHLLEEGIHPKVVQERLGHSSIRITLDTYSHVVPRLQKEVALLADDLI